MPLIFMMMMFRHAASVLLLLVLFVDHARAACIADWSVAAPIVYREKLVTVEVLSRIAADRIAGSVIVRTALCEENGVFSYRIVTRDAHGRLSTLTLDARAPFGK